MRSPCDVFIAVKNLDEKGNKTEDVILAEKIYSFLSNRGISVFFSNISLEKLGVAAYKRAIDDALDEANILVVVGTSSTHIDSQWVRYEWDSFFNDILSGAKPNGKVFVYIAKEKIDQLPRALRQTQHIEHGPGSIERLFRFINNALERPPGEPGLRNQRADRGSTIAVAGHWEGGWKCISGRFLRQGSLSISQDGNILNARLTEKSAKKGCVVVAEETMIGTISSRTIVLHGVSIKTDHVEKQRPYLLDHFELFLDERQAKLSGEFYNNKERGKASFQKKSETVDRP